MRLPLVDPADPNTDPAARAALLAAVGGGDIQPNVYRAMANHLQAFEAVTALARFVYRHSSLTAAQRELAYLTASVTNDCHY